MANVVLVSAYNHGDKIDGYFSVDNNLIKYSVDMGTKSLTIDRRYPADKQRVQDNIGIILHQIKKVIDEGIIGCELDAICFIKRNGGNMTASVRGNEITYRSYNDDLTGFKNQQVKTFSSLEEAKFRFQHLLDTASPLETKDGRDGFDLVKNASLADEVLGTER